MFNRGSGSGIESRRNDESFYRGIVVKNNDPAKLNRVKVYIPELSNQPYDEWFSKYDEINVKMPGINNTTDTWEDVQIFEEIAKNIPWAEPCYPLFGESGSGRYLQNDEESITTISDCNYAEGFQKNDTEFPTLTSGSFAPAFLHENAQSVMGDAFQGNVGNFSVKCNTFSFTYKPQKFSNKTKGVFGVPQVGAKVWVFHYLGELQFPVYFGTTQDFRGLSLINRNDNEENISPYYPSNFEN